MSEFQSALEAPAPVLTPAPAPPPPPGDTLKNNLREFIDLTEQIKNVKRDLKIINERKNELASDICKYMIDNDIPAFKTPNGNVSVYEQKSTKPINKDYIIETLSTKLDDLLAKELAALLVESRPVIPVPKIKVNLKRG
ncbi:hypothetical protein BJ741DRAFT_635210 [Chytriomyces cf. hyalinus JEL632]|nr:hypothetical protein BJ741DRAFT_635210 [Chytriomyces cf. hyalinus JEL632]